MTPAPAAVTPYLPSLEAARSARVELMTRVWWRGRVNLLMQEPTHTHRLAAVVVIATRPNGPHLRYTYVPDVLPFQLEESLTRLLEPRDFDPPECLRFDLERGERGTPYRGVAASGEPEAHGHRFADAHGHARRAVDAFRAAARPHDIDARTYAWPFLWLRFRQITVRRDVALVVRPDLHLHAFVAR